MKDWGIIDFLVAFACACAMVFLIAFGTGCASQKTQLQTHRASFVEVSQANSNLLGNFEKGGKFYSNSMYPVLTPGQYFSVDVAFPYSELKRGDVVIIALSGRRVVHRLHARSGDEWYTKGDNNPYLDDFMLNASNYAGKAILEDWVR